MGRVEVDPVDIMERDEMEFKQLERANRERLPHFRNRNGELAHSQANGHDWSVAEWTDAMAGEVGEACNIAKKLIRGDYGPDETAGIQALLDEIADVVVYADLVCQRVGGNLDLAVVKKFNEVSDRVGSGVKL